MHEGRTLTAAMPAREGVGVSWKRILLPPEHGGWGFLFEPILLGLLVAPSGAGAALGVAAVAAFFTRQPLKLALSDRRRGMRYSRTAAAERAALACGTVAAVALAAALAAGGPRMALPLLAALPLGLVQVVYDARRETREILPELAGSAALAATAPAMALADGWMLAAALGLWLILLARSIPSILYARTMVRRLHGERVSGAPALTVHAAGVAAVGAAGAAGIVPLVVLAAPLLLLVRAALGLFRGTVPARRLGWGEIAFGLAVVGIAALAYP
jgi:hypothetical protein